MTHIKFCEHQVSTRFRKQNENTATAIKIEALVLRQTFPKPDRVAKRRKSEPTLVVSCRLELRPLCRSFYCFFEGKTDFLDKK